VSVQAKFSVLTVKAIFEFLFVEMKAPLQWNIHTILP